MMNFGMVFEGVDHTCFMYERSLEFTVDRGKIEGEN